jgi:hypothetical protein
MRVLIIGGYGTFGGRLVDLLRDEVRLTLVVAGRDLRAAEAFCAARTGSAATLEPARFDRTEGVAAIRALRPEIVVDAAGPFQLYGDDPYATIRAALEAGAHWIDLADGAAFVTGIGALDAAAKAAGRFVLAGASSFPVLTAAVVRRLAAELPDVETITAGIAPSPYAGVGLNVIRAIASYAGQPIELLEDGRRQVRHGLISSRRMIVNVPGRVPLWPIRFALVDVPDLEVLPKEWPGLRSIWVGAGPKPAVLHRLLWLAGWAVRLRIMPSLVPIARLMDWVVNHVRWGEHRGGMIVEVAGGGRKLSWHMLAEGDAGPLIPSMAVEAIVRKYLDGKVPAAGARPAHRELELSDYEAIFARRGIASGVRREPVGTLYQRVLGEAFDRLVEPVRMLHGFETVVRYAGNAEIKGAANALGAIVARVFGFPSGGSDVAVEVELTRRDSVETWTRTFAGRTLRSTQAEGQGRHEGLVVERFGLTGFGMAVTEDDGRLGLVVRRWDVLGIPMPRWLMPRVVSGEHADDGRFHFLVDISLPLLGRLVRYEGWLVQDKSSA